MHDALKLHFQPGQYGVEKLFYRSVVPMAIVGGKDSHEFLDCNQAFAGFFGYTPQEIIGTSFVKYTHPEDIDGDLKAVKSMVERENGVDHYEMDKRYLHKVGGYEVWFHLVVDAIHLEDPDTGDSRFSHFWVVALPYPNGGRYVREERKGGKVTIRPSIDLWEIVRDNKQQVIIFLVVLALLHPKLMELLIAIFK